MTVCPIALSVTCKKCPAFTFCPLKTVIGDHKESDDAKQTTNHTAENPDKK